MVVSMLGFQQGLAEKYSTVQKKDKYLAGLLNEQTHLGCALHRNSLRKMRGIVV
jgi:hypothetical protein